MIFLSDFVSAWKYLSYFALYNPLQPAQTLSFASRGCRYVSRQMS